MDLLRWFCSTEVEWVRSYHRSFKNLVDGYLLAHIRLKNGVDVQHMVHWSSPELSNLAPQTSFELFGTEGIIKIDEKSTNCQLFREGSFIESADTIYSPVASEEIEGLGALEKRVLNEFEEGSTLTSTQLYRNLRCINQAQRRNDIDRAVDVLIQKGFLLRGAYRRLTRVEA